MAGQSAGDFLALQAEHVLYVERTKHSEQYSYIASYAQVNSRYS